MTDRIEMLNEFYRQSGEDSRLEQSRQGQLEHFITMHYIRRYLKPGDHVLEIGAGTGRYSAALAREGYQVTAVELTESNLMILRERAAAMPLLDACQGDALDLSRFPDNAFDITLLFGPMYHLYNAADQHKAIDEAVRVTKPGGVILTAFLSAHAIICTNYLYQWRPTVCGIKENFDSEYRPIHFQEQLFTGFDVEEFERLFAEKDVDYITTAAADNVLEIAENREDFSMTDEDFAAFADYQLHICEKREMLGSSSHLLHICRKRKSENIVAREDLTMTDYSLIIKQMKALSEDSADPIPVMANVSALLFYAMEDINWAGFYLVKDGALVLGPFQGKVACVRIAKGRGVCGTAWAEDSIQLVPDVHAFRGHIACDSASRSEIVVPLHRGGEVIGVLDIDSPSLARFTEADREGLCELVRTLEQIICDGESV